MPLSREEFAKLPPEQQDALINGAPAVSTPKPPPMSKDEFAKLPPEQQNALAGIKPRPVRQAPPSAEQSFGNAFQAVGELGEKVDRYTGAPIRKAIGELQSGKSILESLSALRDQFGKPSNTAPTGKQIAQKAGVTDKGLSDLLPGAFNETGEGWKLQKGGWADISGSGAAGLGIDLAADPVNLLPLAGLAKKAIKSTAIGAKALETAAAPARKAAELFTKSHLNPTQAAKETIGIKAIGEAADEASRAGAIKFGASQKSTAKRLSDLVDETGAVKADAINASKGKIDPAVVAERFDKDIIEPLRAAPVENENLIRQLENKKQKFIDQYVAEGSRISPAQLEAERLAINSKSGGAVGDAKAAQSALYSDEIAKAATEPGFKEAADASKNLENALVMQGKPTATGGLSPMDVLNPKGAATKIAKSWVKGRTSSAASVTAKAVADLIENDTPLFRRLVESGVVTTDVLSSPQVREALSNQSPMQRRMKKGK